MYIKNQDTDFAGHQEIADLVAGGNVPKPSGAAHGFTKRLQKRFVAGQNHEFDDVARETEPQRIQRASFFVGS
jgi:hypothetical protein